MDGNRVVEEKIVTPDENGEWHYTFNAPKYDEDGNKIQYTVVEVPLYNFIPTYDGYNIKNTYLPPVSLDPPILQKFVVGDPGAPSTRFEFLLRGENGEIKKRRAERERGECRYKPCGRTYRSIVRISDSVKRRAVHGISAAPVSRGVYRFTA